MIFTEMKNNLEKSPGVHTCDVNDFINNELWQDFTGNCMVCIRRVDDCLCLCFHEKGNYDKDTLIAAVPMDAINKNKYLFLKGLSQADLLKALSQIWQKVNETARIWRMSCPLWKDLTEEYSASIKDIVQNDASLPCVVIQKRKDSGFWDDIETFVGIFPIKGIL